MTPTFVLIPGASHTASSWSGVARRLREAGRATEVVELPGQRSTDNESPSTVHLDDAPRALVQRLTTRDLRDVVLVGHSLGGYVIGGALTEVADRVARVLYVSAHLPVAGVSMSDAFPERMAPLRAAAEASGDGGVPVPGEEIIEAAFLPGSSPDMRRLVGDLLVPTPGAYFLESLDRPSRPADHGIAFSYLLGEDDLVLPPAADQFARMLDVEPVMVPGGHEALFTDPGPLADALIHLAG